ncbi:MAG: 23S rRNA (adenine(2503)-C(2))-methyltransferase RlmN [Lachnospiraceae bacterium]|nr:23S rRNA (adenine(2503)-C(2))-methyltransferase RlmN [Lachnospiraceae bacterium]
MIKMKDIKSLSKEELKEYIESIGEKGFRADQIFRWLHYDTVTSFDEMTNLSKALREKLKSEAYIADAKIHDCQISKTDGTRKYLFRFRDDCMAESVFMKYSYGNSVCISSQVGCRMGCSFCASTLDGLERNLTASEMLEQIYAIKRDTGEDVSHIVVMGTGEPMDNYDNLLRFLKLINHPEGQNLGHRNITVSTCGIVPKILTLAEEKLQITLAISLHAPNQEKREKLMPVAKAYNINELMDACRTYFDKTGRRISFEYSLIKGENDSEDDAKELSELIRGINCHVNLIPVNPIKERTYRESDKMGVLAFKNSLERNGINVTIRREIGRDIDGACGQLRHRNLSDGRSEG